MLYISIQESLLVHIYTDLKIQYSTLKWENRLPRS